MNDSTTLPLFDTPVSGISVTEALAQRRTSSKAERRFRKLVTQIERQRELLRQWEDYPQRYNQRVSREASIQSSGAKFTGPKPGNLGMDVDVPVARAAMGSSVSLAYGIRSGATADIGREVVPVPKPGPISFSDPMPVDTVLNIRVYLNGDLRDEPEESFSVDLQRSSGGLPLGTSAVTVKLASAEVTTPPPTPTQLGFAATSISQQENQTTLNLSVNRTGSTTGAIAVHYETVGGTATAGSDFTAAAGDLQWAAGDSNPRTIVVTLTNDTAVESTEAFTVKLSAPTGGATLSGDTATVSITDDDTAAPSTGGSGGTGGGSSGSSSGGGGGAFDLTSLVALGLILAFSQLGMRRRSKRRVDRHPLHEARCGDRCAMPYGRQAR